MTDPILLPRRAVLLTPLAFAACKPFGSDIVELAGQTMGTTYTVIVAASETGIEAHDVRTAIETTLAAVNAEMSNWDAASEVSRFNALGTDEAMTLSPGLARVMDGAQDVHAASLGRFDVTVGALVDLWGFGASGSRATAPAEADIDTARAQTGQARVVQTGAGTLRKTDADARIYLSAIGKGHGVDRVAEALETLGATDYMVEIGGDLRTAGRNPDGQAWQIGIETPEVFDRGILRVVPVSGRGLATSGDYRNYFEEDGQRFSHIIDPTTGRPVTHRTASATVVADDAMLADAWATAMLTMGHDLGLEVAAAHDIAVLFVERATGNGAERFVTRTSAAFDALTA